VNYIQPALIVVAASASVSAASTPIVNYLQLYTSIPLWGMPISVIAAATFGAGLSLFFGDPLVSRRALYGQTLAATFFGAGLAVMFAHAMKWDWAMEYTALLALMTSAMVRWFLPTIIERGKQLINEFRFPHRKNDGDGQ